jgi:hypothetical protein
MCVTKVNTVRPDATVYHYDELCEELKCAFPDIVGDRGNSPKEAIRSSHVSSGDYVKFTDYYQVVY